MYSKAELKEMVKILSSYANLGGSSKWKVTQSKDGTLEISTKIPTKKNIPPHDYINSDYYLRVFVQEKPWPIFKKLKAEFHSKSPREKKKTPIPKLSVNHSYIVTPEKAEFTLMILRSLNTLKPSQKFSSSGSSRSSSKEFISRSTLFSEEPVDTIIEKTETILNLRYPLGLDNRWVCMPRKEKFLIQPIINNAATYKRRTTTAINLTDIYFLHECQMEDNPDDPGFGLVSYVAELKHLKEFIKKESYSPKKNTSNDALTMASSGEYIDVGNDDSSSIIFSSDDEAHETGLSSTYPDEGPSSQPHENSSFSSF